MRSSGTAFAEPRSRPWSWPVAQQHRHALAGDPKKAGDPLGREALVAQRSSLGAAQPSTRVVESREHPGDVANQRALPGEAVGGDGCTVTSLIPDDTGEIGDRRHFVAGALEHVGDFVERFDQFIVGTLHTGPRTRDIG